MKANKVTLTITVEVLSIDAAPSLLSKIIGEIDNEFINGHLVADDGDTVTWTTQFEQVSF